jgi:Ser/Thr protein kinase RdoA (MazF antagonist)
MSDVRRVLEEFGLLGASAELLRDTQNHNHLVTTATGQRFLLRQHRVEHLGIGALESEMLWLTFLHERGLEVQRPVRLPSGTYIFQDDDRRFSLLTWLEGEVLEEIDETQARVLGELMAKLHEAAAGFVPPTGFERPRYDRQHLELTLARLRVIAWLSDDLPLFENAVARAKPSFEEDSVGSWGLVHADLHPGNLVWRGSEVAAIDFDGCGFGPLGFDIATALGYLETEPRVAFLEGYTSVRTLPEGFEAHRGMYTVAEWLTNLAFLAPRPHEREYVETVMLPGLREHLPKLIRVS